MAEEIEELLERYHTELHAMIVFHRAEKTIKRLEADVIKKHGLTVSQFSVLELLWSKGPMSIGKLTETTLSTSGNMTVIIRNMERDHLITRRADSSDGLSSLIELTEEGKKAMGEVFPPHIRNVGRIFSILTDDEKTMLITILRKFRKLEEE